MNHYVHEANLFLVVDGAPVWGAAKSSPRTGGVNHFHGPPSIINIDLTMAAQAGTDSLGLDH
jgi:hypothetical protein